MQFRKFYTFIFSILLFWTSNSNSQVNIDSLKKIVANKKLHDTTRLAAIPQIIDNLDDEAEINRFNDLMGKIAIKNLKHKNSISIQKKYTLFLASYYNNLSVSLEDIGDPKSLEYLTKSIQLYKSVKDYDEYYTGLVSKGLLLYRKKQYNEAVDCYFKSLKYFELNEKENIDGIWYVYSNLGMLYLEQDQLDEGIKYLKKSLTYLNKVPRKKTIDDNSSEFYILINLGSGYLNKKNYEEAKMYFQKALVLSKQNNIYSKTSFILGKLGQVYFNTNDIINAEKFLIEAHEKAEDDFSLCFAKIKLSEIYYHKKDYNKSERLVNNGLKLSKKLHNLDYQLLAYELLYKLAKTKGDFRESVKMLELFHTIKDSTKIVENKNEIAQQQLKYDYDKKVWNFKLMQAEKINKMQRITDKKNATKNIFLVLLFSVIVLLSIGAFFLRKNYRQKQAIATFEKEAINQKLLLTQMNPHFIFNSIDNIQSLIYNKQDKEAVNYLTKFSKLTRQILENSTEDYITLSEEIVMIENYLSIQQLLYNNRFAFTITTDEKLDTENLLIPPMLTQPFIENAIKHGLKNIENGEITIEFKLEKNLLFFQIIDNGVGFSTEQKMTNTKSLAMKITKERLTSLSKKSDFKLTAENLYDATNKIIGAKVLFEIPYIYEN